MADSLRSIDLILAEVRTEREGQLKHFDVLDSKAGVILGFAGAIVAITRPDTQISMTESMGEVLRSKAIRLSATRDDGLS